MLKGPAPHFPTPTATPPSTWFTCCRSSLQTSYALQAITNGNELIVRMTAEAAIIEDRDLELDPGSFLTVCLPYIHPGVTVIHML